MKGDALANMLQDRRILVIIVAVIMIIAAAAAYMVLKDDGGNKGPSSTDDLIVGDDQIKELTEDTTVEGNITVENGGTLTIAPGVTVTLTDPEAKINVNGTLNSEGTIQFVRTDKDGNQDVVYNNISGESRSITSTGTMTIPLENYHSETEWGETTIESGINAFISGAVYSSDGKTVTITSLASAANAKELLGDVVYLMGTFSAASVPADVNVIVNEGAKVTLGTVTLANSSVFDATEGIITATVSNGSGSATLTSGSGVIFTAVSSNNTSLLVIEGDVNGAMAIATGSVYVDQLKVDNTGSSLAVNAGATLVLQDIASVAEGQLDALEVVTTGTITGTPLVTINGTMVIGTKPTTTTATATTAGIGGSFTISGTGYVKAYAGVSGIEAKGTEFYIDNHLYMTAYGSVPITTVLSGEAVGISTITQTNFSNAANWNNKSSQLGADVTTTTVVAATGYEKVYYATSLVTINITNTAKATIIIDGVTLTANQTSIQVAQGSYSYSATLIGSTLTSTLGTTTITDKITIPTSTAALTLTVTVSTPTSAELEQK